MVHECHSGNDAIDKEQVPVVGPWEDYTGSADVNSRNQQMWAGAANKFWGTKAGVLGAELGNLNLFGGDANTTRLRQKRIYIDFTKGGYNEGL